MRLLFLLLLLCSRLAVSAGDQAYPSHASVVDVSKPPYLAKGDGVTDDTQALQSALNDHVGRSVLFFPKGTYVVSATLKWPNKVGDRKNWGFTMLRGGHRDECILRLKDGTFTDAKKPAAIMWCGGFGSADWFHNYVENLTFDVGKNNPGATALQFYSNNSGAVRDCRFIAGAGSGVVGLDLAHRDMNGPLLVSRCEVIGFQRGVATGHAVNSQVFEHLSLRGQTKFGFDNERQAISIRGLTSDNAVPALRSYGTMTLIEAKLTGSGSATQVPAVINYNGGRLFLRDVVTTGYLRALADVKTPDWTAALRVTGQEHASSTGPELAEYCSEAPTSPFPSPVTSLRLPIKETPRTVWEAPEKWATVDTFGADPTGKKDSAEAIQKAMDSGAATIFLPGHYRCGTTIIIRGKVQRVVGLGHWVNYGQRDRIDFRIADGESPVVSIEHFSAIHGGIEVDTRRTVVMRSVQDCDLRMTPAAEGGELFFEDFVTHRLKLGKQKAWGRQLNIENEGTHLTNENADLWVLGYKTERGGTLLDTKGGGRNEILGGFSYTTTAGKLAPMFVNDNSSIFAFFAEVCFSGDPFTSLIRETRSTETKEVKRGEGKTTPYSGYSKP